MKKNLFIITGIFLIVVVILSCIYYNYQKITIMAKQKNNEYISYTEGTINGTSLMTLINKACNENERNEVTKNSKNIYEQNEENSIKIEVKFLESDKVISMEAISALGSEQFIKNYNSMTFNCIEKEYHKKTGQIKYMLFEEI